MSRPSIAVRLFLGLALVGGAGQSATVAPPADLGELARLSAAVVLAEALDSDPLAPGALHSALPYTATHFRLIERVGGTRIDERFVVVEPGGRDGALAVAVGGAPRYEAGRTYLLFLDRGKDGTWRSRMLAYGILVEDPATELLEPLPEAGWIEPLGDEPFEPVEAYRKEPLLEHLRRVLDGAPWNRESAGAVPALSRLTAGSQAPSGCEYLTWDGGDGLPVRWFGWEEGTANPAAIRPTTPGQTGIIDGGLGAVVEGTLAWFLHEASVIRYESLPPAPRDDDCGAGNDNELGAVWFNDPCNDIPPLNECKGTLAFGGASFQTATQLHDGAPWHPAEAPFVVVNDDSECVGETGFLELMTHELGHSVGFGHHDATPPPNPTMSALLKNDGRGASLVGRDKTCASFAYHTFLDVPFDHPFWAFIEAVEDQLVTSGCVAGFFCPEDTTSRAQMALFLLRAKEGPNYLPPPCTSPGPFSDVPCSHPFAAWIEELVERGVTSGCGDGAYCPGDLVTRAQMAVFLLRAFEGPGYTPPACSGAGPFGDVAPGDLFCPWIQELVNRSITSGCGGGNYCPGTPTKRGQMAVFLTKTFDLPLPD